MKEYTLKIKGALVKIYKTDRTNKSIAILNNNTEQI